MATPVRSARPALRLTRTWTMALCFAAAACGPSAEDGPGAFSAGEDAAATAEPFAPTYFAVRSDPRLCPAPTCGGFWVSAVNTPSTRCADGSAQRECYAATLDLSALKLPAAQEAQLRAAIGATSTSPAVLFQAQLAPQASGTSTLGVLVASQAWLAPAAGTVAGPFYGLAPSGIVCVAAPCPTIRETLLDLSRPQDVSQVDLSRAPGTDADKAAAQEAVMSGEGLIAAGTNRRVHDRTWTVVLQASQYYRKVVPLVPVDPCAGVDCGPGAHCVAQPFPSCVPDPVGVRCGSTICPVGQVCCNPVMDICTLPGQFCVM